MQTDALKVIKTQLLIGWKNTLLMADFGQKRCLQKVL